MMYVSIWNDLSDQAMDFAHRTIFCNTCDDYVYDTELNDLIVRQETLQVESGHSKLDDGCIREAQDSSCDNNRTTKEEIQHCQC